MSDDESKELKAGHPPAVKAGGMRIVQHKTPNTERPAKSEQEDATGLTSPPNITPSNSTVSGAPDKGMATYTPEAAQVAHQPKPVQNVPQPRVHNINQPRK